MERCIFLLTGDLHGQLTQSAEAQIAALRQENENTLLLDAGDAVQAGNLGPGKSRQPILEQMNRIGYDAMAMGNRESHPFRAVLERKLSTARFPVLAANIMAKRQPLPKQIKSHLLRRLPNGVKTAIIGLAPQITAPESWWSKVTDYVFDAPEKTVAGLASKLRDKVDLLVILSHCGLEIDRKLAKLKKIDLILGGHSHNELFEQPEGCAPILHSGQRGRAIGVAEVILECGKIVEIKGELKHFRVLPKTPTSQ